MASNRNREAGNNFERVTAQKLRELGYRDVRCSRECSRLRDSKKVDLCNADEDEFGRLPFNLQCKSYSSRLNYIKLIEELEEHNKNRQMNIVLHRYTEKSSSGKRFVHKGSYAIMKDFDFLKLCTSEESVLEKMGGLNLTHLSLIQKRNCINYIKMFLENKNLGIITAVSEEYEEYVLITMDLFWELIKLYKQNE